MAENNQAADENQANLGWGIVAGVIGGLVASWVMNEFMADAGPKIQQVVERIDGKRHGNTASEQGNGDPKEDAPTEDATMKTADAVVSALTGGKHLSLGGKQKGGPIVHYAFGGMMGCLYGALAEYYPAARAGFGTGFAGVLFAGADLVAVPVLNLSDSPGDYPVSSLATPFAAHMVFGVTTECVRRLVRAVL